MPKLRESGGRGAGEPWESACPTLPSRLHGVNPSDGCAASGRSTPLGASASLTYSGGGTAVLPEPSSRDTCLSMTAPAGTGRWEARPGGQPPLPPWRPAPLDFVLGLRLCAGIGASELPYDRKVLRTPSLGWSQEDYVGLALRTCRVPCYALAETPSRSALRVAGGVLKEAWGPAEGTQPGNGRSRAPCSF